MEYREYMRRIEEAIGGHADKIDDAKWCTDFLTRLNEISVDCANELQKENQVAWDKKSCILDLQQAPPARLLALELALASWLGWIMHEKHGDTNLFSSNDCSQRIKDAFDYGVQLSKEGKRP